MAVGPGGMNYDAVTGMAETFNGFGETMQVAKTALDIAIAALAMSFFAGNFGAGAQIAYLQNIQTKAVALMETSTDLNEKLIIAVNTRQESDSEVASSNTDSQ